jgi:hypothetical protein
MESAVQSSARVREFAWLEISSFSFYRQGLIVLDLMLIAIGNGPFELFWTHQGPAVTSWRNFSTLTSG